LPDGADEDYDPDIAHIVAGPQPLPWQDEGQGRRSSARRELAPS
jgi:hypothetical protein